MTQNNPIKYFVVISFFVLVGCSTEPQPLQYGKDLCHTCKMTLMDEKFGAELVTAKGKVYKFDDINCMVNFYNSGYVEPGEFTHKLVIDFNHPKQLIEADFSYFLMSDSLRTPMASGIASFASETDLKAMKKKMGGIYLSWQETLVQFK
jgi:copper chaperone NosL